MGYITTSDNLKLFYEEYGEGDNYILSAQVGFYPKGMHQYLAKMGYHVYCLTLRGFAPSSYVTEDYGEDWYNKFADDVVCLADTLNIKKFVYMGASHGAGLGWHLVLRHPERVSAFVAVVPGPHSLKEGVMSYRQMMMQGIIDAPPPFDPPINNDEDRLVRRQEREEWLKRLPEADPREKAVDYGRPLLYCKTEEKLCETLATIQTPTLILGGAKDPISTPELMMRTASLLPNCKLIMYSNFGHNIDTDIFEELSEEADRFLKQVSANGKYYAAVKNE